MDDTMDGDDLKSPARKKMCPPPSLWQVKNSVRVSNLPRPLMERTVISFFEKLRMKRGIEPDTKSCVVRVVDFPRENFIFIEFVNADIAHRVGMLNDVFYQRSTLLELESPVHLDMTTSNETLGMSFNVNAFSSSTPERARRSLCLASQNKEDDDTTAVAESFVKLSPFKSKTAEIDDELAEVLPEIPVKVAQEECSVIATAALKITNLPEDFSENVLTYEIHKKLWKESSIKKPHRPVVLCEKISSKEALVTFDSVGAATTAASLSPYPYDDLFVEATQVCNVEMKLDMPMAEKPTSKVKITNLPEDFSENVLTYEIHKKLWKESSIKKPHRPVVLCEKISSKEALVTFDSIDAATTAASLSPYPYEDLFVEATQVFELMIDVAAPEISAKVKITNLPEDFSENVLTYEIHKKLWKESSIKKPHRPVVLCEKISSKEALVTFDSVDAATTCVAFSPYIYEDEEVLAVQVIERPAAAENKSSASASGTKIVDDSDYNSAGTFFASASASGTKIVDDSDYNSAGTFFASGLNEIPGFSGGYYGSKSDDEEEPERVLEKNSTGVQVSFTPSFRVPSELHEKLVAYINEKMVEAGFITKDDSCILKALEIGSLLVLQFSTCEEANCACLLENLSFFGFKMNLQKYALDCANNVISLPQTKDTTLNVFDGPGSLMYAQMLIKYREKFGRTGHNKILEAILKKLRRQGVVASLGDLRLKRDRMKKLYNKKKSFEQFDHEFFGPGSVMFDKGDISLVKGTSYDPAQLNDDSEGTGHEPAESDDEKNSTSESSSSDDLDDDDSRLERYCKGKGSTWDVVSSSALVDTLIDRHREFDLPIKKKKLWKNVTKDMKKEGYYFNWTQCRDRAGELKRALKDYNDEYQRSGSKGPLFQELGKDFKKLMQKVAELHKGSVAVNPRVTISAGLKDDERRANKSLKGNDKSTKIRSGKARPNVLSRGNTKKELEERKVKSMELKAKAFYLLSKQAGRAERAKVGKRAKGAKKQKHTGDETDDSEDTEDVDDPGFEEEDSDTD